VQILSKGKVKFLMPEYINSILEEAPVDMASTGVTPAASNLFTVRKDVNKLDNEMAKTCHHLTAMLLYLCKSPPRNWKYRPQSHSSQLR
jgi:hypothetical protein